MTHKPTDQELAVLRKQVLDWFAHSRRSLPWRRDYAPYEIWIAEIMGQQTQLDRAAEYFVRWMRQFPDATALATAPEQTVLKAWEGLGYYSRARNLHRAAQQLVAQYGGQLPADEKALLALPGIGSYTAAAILSIGFNQPVPLVDANVERLFARFFDLEIPVRGKAGQTVLRELAARFLDPLAARNCNEALMEFGERVCTPKKPLCLGCPLHSACLARQRNTVGQRPVLPKRPERIDIVMACGILRSQGRLYIQQRLPEDVWGGLWEFPGGKMEPGETPEETVRREIREETGWLVEIEAPFRTVVHHYTRYRVTLHSFLCRLAAGQGPDPVLTAASRFVWADSNTLADYPFPAGHRQLVAALNQQVQGRLF